MAKDPCDRCQDDMKPVCICPVIPPITNATRDRGTSGTTPTPPPPPAVPQPMMWYVMRPMQLE